MGRGEHPFLIHFQINSSLYRVTAKPTTSVVTCVTDAFSRWEDGSSAKAVGHSRHRRGTEGWDVESPAQGVLPRSRPINFQPALWVKAKPLPLVTSPYAK